MMATSFQNPSSFTLLKTKKKNKKKNIKPHYTHTLFITMQWRTLQPPPYIRGWGENSNSTSTISPLLLLKT